MRSQARKPEGRLVMDPNHLPYRLPVTPVVVTALVLDRLAAPGWAWALAAGFWGVVWLAVLYDFATRRRVVPRVEPAGLYERLGIGVRLREP